MANDLRRLLARAEHLRDGVFTPEDAQSWLREQLAKFETLGVIEACGLAGEIIYDGCDHECTIVNSGFQQHPDDPTRVICVHRCLNGCGRVLLDPQDFEQWRFSLLGLAGVVRNALGASGQVIEDIPGRVVLAGTISNTMRCVDVFVASGMTRDDAAAVLLGSDRLQVAQEPFVFTLATIPDPSIWPGGMRPAVAVLAEHARLGPTGLKIDLEPLLALESIPHHRASTPRWLTNKDAATRLKEVVSKVTFEKAKSRVSVAASRQAFRTNGQTGDGHRIETASFMDWLWRQRAADLAKDDNLVEDKPAKRRYGAAATSPRARRLTNDD